MELLSENLKKTMDHWLTKFPVDQKRSAVVAALLAAQQENEGWLPESVMQAVAEYLQLSTIEVVEVATFYDMFELKPIGKHKIGLCTNVSCKLRGSDDIADALEKRLGVKLGETTADNQFTLRETECLGACANAPMCQHNDQDYHEDLTVDKMMALIDKWQQEGRASE